MKKPLVTGATGFVGSNLCRLLPDANVLTRRPEAAPASLSRAACFRWQPEAGPPPPEALEGVDAVFHLAGEPVAQGRWSAAKKARIRNSRTVGTSNLVQGLRALDRPPAVLVSASAVGYYGSRGEEVLDERSAPATGFLPEVCRDWEAAAMACAEGGTRVVTIRIGLVLGPNGGALAKMLPPFKLGLGGPLGDGRQWVPWIHVDDLARLFVFAAEAPDLEGPLNGTAPDPVPNREFTRALGRAVRRPALLPTPAFALRSALGEFAEVLLASQRVLPRAAERAGFDFRYRNIEEALAAAVG